MNLEECYFKDNFTKDGEMVDLEIDKLTASCIVSKNNRFSLDSNGNLSVNSITTEVPIVIESVTDIIYPVGSIYMSVNGKNPAIVFGGTWEQIKDRFLLSCGDRYFNGTMGGEENHQLTVDEMPSHNHSVTTNANFTIGNNQGMGISGIPADTAGWGSYKNAHWYAIGIDYKGGNQPHNNMPPYLAVYVWKRIA